MRKLLLSAGVFGFGVAAFGGSPVWLGGSGTWSDPVRWLNGAVPVAGDTVYFSNTVANASVLIDAPVSIASLRLEGTKSVTFRGEKLTLTGTSVSLKAPNPKPTVPKSGGGTEASNNLRDYGISVAPLLCYYAGGTFSNDVEFASTKDAGLLCSAENVRFYGKVTAPSATTFQIHNGISEEKKFSWSLQYADLSSAVDFFGGFEGANASVYVFQAPSGPVNFYTKVVAKKIYADQWTSSRIAFHTDDVTVADGALETRYSSNMAADVENGFPTNAVFEPKLKNKSNSVTGLLYDCGAFPQTIDRMAGDLFGSYGYDKNGTVDGSSTLTLRGTQGAVTPLRVQGSVSLVWDPAGDFTQAFTGRVHTTTGDIAVKRGTFRLLDGATFANVGTIRVAAGATFDDQSTVAGSLANVKKVVLSQNATLKFGPNASTPFSGNAAAVFVDADAKIYVPEGTSVTIPEVYLRGVPLAATSYAEASWLAGGGTVTVAKAPVGTFWKNESGGAWNDADNWTDGVPSAEKAAYVTCYGDFTITMPTPTQVPVALTVDKESGATTLNVTGTFAFDAGQKLTFGKGAKLVVPTDGAFVYDGSKAATKADTEVAVFRDGASVEVNGGLFSFTNMTGIVNFGVKGATDVRRITVTAGRFVFFRKGSTTTGGRLMSYPGTKLTATGGELVFGSSASGQWCLNNESGDFRLDQDYDGTAVLKRVNAAASNGSMYVTTMGPGEIRHCGSSRYVLEKFGTTGNIREYIMASEGNAMNLSFEGNMTVASTIGGDGLYIYGKETSPVDIWWGARKTGTLGAGSYLYNNCHLHVTNGLLVTGQYGMRVGCNNGDSSSVEVSSGCLSVNASFRKQGIDGLSLGYGIGVSSGKRLGELTLSDGGVVSNTSSGAIYCGMGCGATGRLRQTGGVLYSKATKCPCVVGFAGGEGLWEMSGGTATVKGDLWIGGCPTNRYGQIFMDWSNNPVITCPHYDGLGATGTVVVVGGAMTVDNTVTVGAGDYGRLEVNGGSLTIKDLALSNNTASVVSFRPVGESAGSLIVSGTLTVKPGSKLVIDMSDFTGRRANLLSWGAKVGDFAADDVSYTPPKEGEYKLTVTSDRICVKRLVGSSVFVR